MFFARLRFRALFTVQFVLLAGIVLGDPVLPGNILDPRSAPEAWNVIRLATANVDRLVQENRLSEIPVQISFCSPSLRVLAREADSADKIDAVQKPVQRALGWVAAVASASLEKNIPRTTASIASLHVQLEEIARQYDAKSVAADIYCCPMHPDIVSELPGTPCAKCGMSLLPRRIPYSFIYTKPGEPTIRLTAIADRPIIAGQKVSVRARLEQGDGTPVKPADLLVMHTQPIHLLIQDPSLRDYHHEHPVPTETPGEYTFSFTPAFTAPYRVWADIVPVLTGVQELPFTDLPSSGKGDPVTDTGNRFSCTAGRLEFKMALRGENGNPVHARQTCGIEINVTDSGGQPVTRLQPLMNAFAHLVGFYDDYHTVVHLHPSGGDVLNPDLRGGPRLSFVFYPPKPGFIRLYCQVCINGEFVFAPFNVNITP